MYYIVGKKTVDGTLASDSTSGTLSEYFELGWEYAVSHLYIKYLYSIGKLNKDDTIVTLKDRMFLYQGFWPNVMSYENFIHTKINNHQINDICNEIQSSNKSFLPKIHNGKYIHWDIMSDIIMNIKYKDIKHLNSLQQTFAS